MVKGQWCIRRAGAGTQGMGRRVIGVLAAIAMVSLVLPLWAGPATSAVAATGEPAQPPMKHGGSMTVLEVGASEGADPQGLDPATNANGGANQDYMDAIYGALFQLNAAGKPVPDLATGYKFLDGMKTVEIFIRHGVKFSDGTPFNAAAVAAGWTREFQLKVANDPPWPITKTNPFTTAGPYTAVIHMSIPYSPIINSLFDKAPNWIESPTALKREGAKQFPLAPVGAGPYVVTKNVLSTELRLRRNPLYWQKGRPYLDTLIFKTVNSDQSALEALRSGQAQAYTDMTTMQLVPTFKSAGLTVDTNPGTSPTCMQLNTTQAPFNNILAREAVTYATNTPLLDKELNHNQGPPVQGFTAPHGLFYYPRVPGYRTYNLAKAKALVKRLGGLSFTLLSATSGPMLNFDEALQTLWRQAGMKVTLEPSTLPQILQSFSANKWNAVGCGGSWDPATGVGQNDRFLSNAPFTGVHDKHLDMLLNKATEVPNNQRDALYRQVARYEAKMAYVIEFYPVNNWDVATKGVSAPGLTIWHPTVIVAPEVWWQDAGYTQSS
ncbi:MAG: ABC transporter substrate-binding protein [Acidimicrobiaceae bacterium]|nr:ABC transporter substrate-binding protein [Acidimicrobiaceae bacterium]